MVIVSIAAFIVTSKPTGPMLTWQIHHKYQPSSYLCWTKTWEMPWFPAEHGVSSEIQVLSLLSVLGQRSHVPGRKKNRLWSNGKESLGIAEAVP